MLSGAEPIRAPMNDFPPPYASSWGDDRFGLWVGVIPDKQSEKLRLRWIEPKLDGFGRVIEKGYWMLPESISQDQVHGLIEKIAKLVDGALVYDIKGYDKSADPEVPSN